jgi:putative DNA primase/helicase
VFSDDDPFCGIDLDKCRDLETGKINADAQKIIDDFASYTEISPSGKGVHIILNGKKPGPKCRKENIEIYDTKRYFTFTGNVLNEHRTIELRQEQLDKLYDSLFAKEEKPSAPKAFANSGQAILSDDQVLMKAKNAQNSAKFSALWSGDISGYKSASEADCALCCELAWWTRDNDQIDRLFRQSGLYREKWDRQDEKGKEDYKERTINAALEYVTESYDPNYHSEQAQPVHHDTIPDKVLDEMAEKENTEPKAVVQEVDLFQKKKTKEDFCPYFKKDTFIPKLLADDILSDNRFINVKGLLYRYQNGVYIDDGEQFIEAESQMKLGNESRQNRISETVYFIKVDSYTEPELVNPTDKGHLINVQNGLYDWIEGKLLPHTPDHLSTIRIPIEYNPEATCPTVDYFLNSTLPADCVPIAEELFGYALIPYVRFEKAFMFTGTGANGKSTFLILLEKFVGSGNVSKVPLQDLDEHRFKRAELFGKLLNLFADLDARDLQSSTYFKTIVSGDAIDAERKFQDPFFFRPFARLAFSANEIPKSPDNSYAYFRRWCIIPFPKRFEGKDADKSLADKMTEPSELSGLLNRALKGLHRLFESEGFTESVTIRESLDNYKKQNDTVAAFINDYCELRQDLEIERTALYDSYVSYCKKEGYEAISRIACYNKVRAYPQVGEKKEPKTRCFTGIGIKGNQ